MNEKRETAETEPAPPEEPPSGSEPPPAERVDSGDDVREICPCCGGPTSLGECEDEECRLKSWHRELLESSANRERRVEEQRARARGARVGHDEREGVVYARDAGATVDASWLMRRMGIAPGRPTLMTGEGDSGKAILQRDLGFAIAIDGATAWGGLPVDRHGAVLHLNYEEPEPLHRLYWQRMARGRGRSIESLGTLIAWITMPRIRLSEPDAQGWLADLCQGRLLCTIDSLGTALPGVDESSSELSRGIDVMTRVSLETGCAFVVSHHSNRDRVAGRAGPPRGRSVIRQEAQSVIWVSADHDERKLYHRKSAFGALQAEQSVRILHAGPTLPDWDVSERLSVRAAPPKASVAKVLDLVGAADLRPLARLDVESRRRARIDADILEFVDRAGRQGRAPSANAVADQVRGKKAEILARLRAMLADGRLQGPPYRVAIEDPPSGRAL